MISPLFSKPAQFTYYIISKIKNKISFIHQLDFLDKNADKIQRLRKYTKMANVGIIIQNPISLLHQPSKGRSRTPAFILNPSEIFSSNSVLMVKEQILTSATRTKRLKHPKVRASPVVYAAQSNFLKGASFFLAGPSQCL